MKLEVGIYVRTDNGMKFGKVTEIHNVSGKVWYKIDTGVGIDKSQLTKNKIKHRIIDLIEVGDYVNGFSVIHKENDILKCGLLVQFKEIEQKEKQRKIEQLEKELNELKDE